MVLVSATRLLLFFVLHHCKPNIFELKVVIAFLFHKR